MGHQRRGLPLRAERPSTIEQLESRKLLTGTAVALSASAATADGLIPLRVQGEHTFAVPGQWMAVINRPAGSTSRIIRQINAQLAGTGLRAVRRLNATGIFLFRGPEKPIDQVKAILSKIGDFQSVEPDTIRSIESLPQTIPNDPSYTSQWGLNQANNVDINAPEAWTLSTGSRQVVTAVIDTGVDYNNPDLAANMWTNPGEVAGNGVDDDGNGYVDDIHGYDFANNDGDPMDDNGHGTLNAGIIGAVGNNGVGTVGVNWQTSIMALKFIGANGIGYTSNAVACLNYIDMMFHRGVNVRVANNSWIGSYSAALQLAIDQLNNDGILFVAAAGNGGTDYVGDNNDQLPTWPASMPEDNVISVAATDQNDQLASFSNYGATSVDLAAPGVSILSTSLGNTYGYGTGTSHSTPFVAGVAALAFAYAPNATAAQVKAAILNGVDQIPSMAGKCVSGGRLDAYNTLMLLVPPPTGTGLNVTYYDNKDFTGTSVIGPAGNINFNWGGNSPIAGIGNTTWSARWSGEIQPQFSEPYTFYTLADDGVRVTVNGQQIINRWSNHPPVGDMNGDGIVNAMDFGKLSSYYAQGGAAVAPYDLNGDGVVNSADFTILASNFGKTVDPIQDSGTITLTAGQKYDITVEYYQNYSVASMKLYWSSPSTPNQIVPTLRLYAPGTPATPLNVTAAASGSLFSTKPVATDPKDPLAF
jgi:subtilisin family serine protease